MKKTVIAILIAVLVVAIGGGLIFAGLSAINFKFDKLDRTEYTTSTYDFIESVREIDVEGHTADVELLASADSGCKVVCFENDREKYAVSSENGRLVVRPVDGGKFRWSLFSLPFKTPKISVYLPAGTYDLMKAQLDTGDITADKALSFETVDVSLDTGDLTFSGVQARRITVHSDTGDIRLGYVTPETVALSVETGKIDVFNVVCSGDLCCESSTGDIRLTDVDAANLYLSASTGDITGTVLTEKTFSANTTTGKVSVPNTAAVGLCKAQTSTGDIRLSISGK